MSLISVQGVRKVYRVDRERIVALSGVSLDIEEGEICCILGTKADRTERGNKSATNR